MKRHNLVPIARIHGMATAGVEPRIMGIGPVPAVTRLLEQTGRKLSDYDLVELNEAFAVQLLACLHDLPIDSDRLNCNGGAIALGHPLGGTGSILLTKALYELERADKEHAIITMCCGGGLGTGTLLKRG